MTNEEAIIASLQITGYSPAAVQKALIDAGINGSATYTLSDKNKINAAAVVVLQGMLSVASISEGGYSVSYSIEGVKARIAALGGSPKVRSRPVW